MTYALEFLPEAFAEAEAVTLDYEARSAGLGVRFRQCLDDACQTLSQHPLLWRERPGGYRRVNLPQFPYYIAYFLREELVIIAAVAHASREPHYWKNRLP